MPSIYTLNLTALLALNGALFYARQQSQPSSPKPTPSKDGLQSLLTSPLTPFLSVYTLIMASDWLQGPYLYPLYTKTHSLPPHLIPPLFTTGFLSGAISGSFIGSLADTHGRKSACLSFCLIYALSCLLTTASSSLPVLFLGRMLGGLGTSLLFTVFESFLVSDFKNRGLEGRLGEMFGVMSTANSVVAIASGVVGEGIVGWAGTEKAPFWLAVVMLLVAGGVIWCSWEENYGQPARAEKDDNKKKDDKIRKTGSSLLKTLCSPTVLALGLSTTVFEGSMYLFVFFWAPALQSLSSAGTALPYGVIFAAFMASTLASSLIFSRITSRLSFSSLLLALLGVSSACFFLASSTTASSQFTFWVFCLFEACVGMYFPTMGYLKGKLIGDEVRSQVYGFLRIPLNVFVVVALLITGRMEGERAFVEVFRVCSGLLLVAAGGFWGLVVKRGGDV
ncbi:putative major facilitator superfamily transporter [Triangularia verruculosa]|uniref:Molybdate-anion transporter n=1 Tax=Triangularia verruculosa TaxID=2587418 RepID=A0AAN6XCC4_9PEZI|nr:putative major facilitator superfamily transporter [Triangularia verruculosa]